jgi:hypothetical protein
MLTISRCASRAAHPDGRSGWRRCDHEAGCCWRGSCPVHDTAGADPDPAIAALMRERPFTGPARSGADT